MNASGAYYRQGVYIQGQDSNNGIFYLDSLFTFISNRPIETALRDISEFTLIYKPTGDTFRIYAAHLKASTGSANEAQRSAEVDSLRKVTNQLPAGSEFVVCGDFNIYGDYEAAYQKLVQDDVWNDGEFNDPFQLSGVWNNASYRFYHTQSTRTTQFGGGSYGGMDDRFDMILYSNGTAQSGGMYYLPGTCRAFGNDGNHYQLAVNAGTNGAVSQAVADALHLGSDHLPVMADFEFGGNSGIPILTMDGGLDIFPNPAHQEFYLRFHADREGDMPWSLYTVSGSLVEEGIMHCSAGMNNQKISLCGQPAAGRYVLSLKMYKSQISKSLYISN
jgi:hypothetical protein